MKDTADEELSIQEQLCFDLKPAEPYAAEYFVPHSGVIEAERLLNHFYAEVCANPREFRFLYLYGSAGTGKTHLLESFKSSNAGSISESVFIVLELGQSLSDEQVAEVVMTYDKVKQAGGLLVFSARVSPHDLTNNPHALSRFLAATPVLLAPPREEELEPIVRSLMERRNLRISDPALQYLLVRIPANLLSFGEVLDRLAVLCFSDERPAKRAAAKDVLENPGKK
jgi:chromosomal replication initiation ATPase DnaA